MAASVYSVTQISGYIKNMFITDYLLNSVCVQGEVSNCKYHTSGHIYFTLKDESAAISCVMFSGNARSLSFRLSEGMKVNVTGSISIYERDSKYELFVKKIEQDGQGDLYRRFEKLKEELEDRGLFAREYKQSIPHYITKLGIVTASTGAAVHDIINISSRRNPYVQLYLYPAQVQGAGAAQTIVKGIEVLDSMNLDCIIVGRGGGSIEDLWPFNEECVAQAVFDCNTPVISAVGHDTDFTITDFVADMRAPTPSAAAELAVFDYNAFLETLSVYVRRMDTVMEGRLSLLKNRLSMYRLMLDKSNPQKKTEDERSRLTEFYNRIKTAMDKKLTECRHRLDINIERLKGSSPLEKLSSGYAFVTVESGERLKTVSQIKKGDAVFINLTDGMIKAVVEDCDNR